MPATLTLGDAPRILISRLSHIGDCILTIPLANAIRDQYPDAFIAWAIEAPGDILIHRCAAINEVVKVPKSWLRKPRLAWQLRKRLRKLQFDVAIDPQSLTKSSGISWLSGAKTRIGLKPPLGRELSLWLNNSLVDVEATHVVDRSIEMLTAIGIQQTKPRFDLNLPESARSFAEQTVESYRLQDGYIVINPGAGWASRQWSNQRFGEVAAHLGKSHGLTSVVTWFGNTEQQMAREITGNSSGHAVMAPPSRIWELAALIRSSRFYLGCDTGPTHLAAAMGTPCITLFGTTMPEISGPYDPDPEFPRHIRIQKSYQSGSSRERRKAENSAMLEITSEDVISAVDRMMDRTGLTSQSRVA